MIKKTLPKGYKLELNVIPFTVFHFLATISQVISTIVCNVTIMLRNVFTSSSRISQHNLHRSFFKFYFHLKIDYSFEDSQSPQRFAREFSLWCGRGTEPSAIARGRGETKIIDLIEGADKRPFTSLWITLRVSTCIYIRYIYILACLIRLDEQPDG